MSAEMPSAAKDCTYVRIGGMSVGLGAAVQRIVWRRSVSPSVLRPAPQIALCDSARGQKLSPSVSFAAHV